MRKNVIVALSIVLTVFISSPAFGADGPYVSGNIGMAAVSDSDVTDSSLPGTPIDLSHDKGFTLGAALGYHFGSVGFETEIAYQKNDLDQVSMMGSTMDLSGDSSVFSLLANGYYAFLISKSITPYVSAGVGLAQVKMNNFGVPGSGLLNWSDDDMVFAYQVGAGIGYNLSDRFNIGLKYRYFGTSDPEFSTTDADFTSHNILLVIKRSF